VNFGLFVATAIYLGSQKESVAAKWGPFICVVVGAMMVMFDLTRHVLLDLGLAGEEMAMYANDEGALSPVGLIGVTCTWVGLVFVMSGIAWYANLPSKLAKAWDSITQRV